MTRKAPETSAPKSRFPDGFRILKGTQEYITYVEHSSVRIWMSDVAAHYDNHMHSAIEIIMPHSGVSSYQLENEAFNVHQGEILFIPSGCPHALTEPPETFRHLLLFEPNPLMSLRDIPSIAPLLHKPVYLHGNTPLQREVSALLSEVIDCYNRHEPLWNAQCYAYLLQVYAALGKDYLTRQDAAAAQPHQSIDSPIMNSAVTFINEHYMDDISLEQVAAFAGFSKYYFSRTFKSFMGLSFSDYLVQKRLNVAAELLVRSNQSIRSIAEASGFSSTATFNRVFRTHKNCTPTQFRAIYGSVVIPTPAAAIL